MFDHPHQPQHLIESLIAFVEVWHGGIRSWYGIASEKLKAVSLPKPLAQLYGALGNMPGSLDHPFPFGQQDRLFPFEFLSIEGCRLLFAAENQGCWRAYTQLSGDDPRVWFRAEEDQPELEHPSLANFLVTLCLQELTTGCPALYAGEGLKERLERTGHRVSPLWLDGLFPGYDRLLRPAFYLVDGRALLFDDHWIGFQTLGEAGQYSDALAGAKRTHPVQTVPMAEVLSSPDTSDFAKHFLYEHLAREFQAQADALQAKAEECRRAASDAMRRSGGG